MTTIADMSDAQLYAERLKAERVQEANHPDSRNWKIASSYIHALHAENNKRHPDPRLPL